MDIPTWIVDPHGGLEAANEDLQGELIEISSNEELKAHLKNGYQKLWLQANDPEFCPKSWKVVEKFLIAFPSSYLDERGFSAVTNLITKKRNRLEIVARGDLRLNLTKFTLDIKKLVSSHRIHSSGRKTVRDPRHFHFGRNAGNRYSLPYVQSLSLPRPRGRTLSTSSPHTALVSTPDSF